MKLCECGCGQPAPLASKTLSARGWVKGQPIRFVHGHSTRTPEARARAAEMGRAGKGRKLTAEHRARLSASKTGSLHPAWKGEAAGYLAKHMWMYRHFEKRGVCEKCGRSGKTDWANLSGEYRRERSDWIEWCRSCHFRYDFARGSWSKGRV